MFVVSGECSKEQGLILPFIRGCSLGPLQWLFDPSFACLSLCRPAAGRLALIGMKTATSEYTTFTPAFVVDRSPSLIEPNVGTCGR
jgi:hypothetical protein